MNAGIKAFTEYQQTNAATAVMDASPHQLTQLLLKAAMDKLSVAVGAVERNDIQLRVASIARAIDIVIELKSTLDVEKGGDVAAELDRLYQFVLDQLLDANLQSDTSKLQAAREIIGTIHEAWVQIAPSRGDG
ncbi:flagellar biosynthetic protein FliS [gamma proteobacterium HIMB55]|nr:flagellar biosynthetic protein FliS [gamma proteobacterium HIMB55]